MRFLTQYDIDVMIKPDYLNQITTNTILMNNAETSAIAEASAYITQRFDTDYLFRPYVVGATVSPGLTGVSIPSDGRILWTDGFIYVNSLTQSVEITSEVFPGSTFSATQSWANDDRQVVLILS